MTPLRPRKQWVVDGKPFETFEAARDYLRDQKVNVVRDDLAAFLLENVDFGEGYDGEGVTAIANAIVGAFVVKRRK